jgi:hypothetical protein
LVSAQPTVSAVPCEEEVVVTLDPPWLSLWLAPPLTPALVESAAPELTVSDALALMARPEECDTLSAAPVVCELPVDDDSAWLVPSDSAWPSVQPWEALAPTLATPGTPALTLAPTVLLCDWLAVLDWLAVSATPWLCELPVELLSVCPVAEPELTETPLPVACAWPAESVWPALADQPLEAPSEVPQLAPSDCATPVDWLSVCEPESVWLLLSVCEPESVWLTLSVCAPDAVLATLSVWPQPELAETPCAEPTVSVTVVLSVWLTPWLWLSPTEWPHDCDSLWLHPSLTV